MEARRSLWRGNVIRRHAAFESPAAVFPHEEVVVAACLRDYRLTVGGRRDESPTRPCGRAVAVHHDFEVRKDVIRVAAVRTGAEVLLHECQDFLRAAGRAEA